MQAGNRRSIRGLGSYHHIMKPCISQVTTLAASFEDDIIGYAEGGCPAIEVWLTKLETHLESASAEDTKKLITDRGITLSSAAYQGAYYSRRGKRGPPTSSISSAGSICVSSLGLAR
jgi:hypothetical protein